MGLTISYGLKSRAKTSDRARAIVERMRQLALDLPFESVDDTVRRYGPDICQRPLDELRENDEVFSAVVDASEYVTVSQRSSVQVRPLEIFSFYTVPGPGSEWAGLGLARYPTEIEVEGRKIKTRLSGWRYSSFCKTQYASEPDCGGVPNFIRCHLCVIHLLERIAKLPTITMTMNDEGKYGPSRYSDNPCAEPVVYTQHDGRYNVAALIEEVGKWNEMIAAQLGAWRDAAQAIGPATSAPIASYPDFEHLEFKGQQQEGIGPFLAAMRRLAERKP